MTVIDPILKLASVNAGSFEWQRSPDTFHNFSTYPKEVNKPKTR